MIMIVTGATLGFNGLKNGMTAINTTVKPGISQEDRDLYQNLDSMKAAPLPDLKASLEKLDNLADGAFEVTLAPAASKKEAAAADGKAKAPEQASERPKGKVGDYSVYGDRIGSYVDATITFKGEIFDQLIFLEEFYNKMSSLAVVKTVKGAADKFEMEVRIYGQ